MEVILVGFGGNAKVVIDMCIDNSMEVIGFGG